MSVLLHFPLCSLVGEITALHRGFTGFNQSNKQACSLHKNIAMHSHLEGKSTQTRQRALELRILTNNLMKMTRFSSSTCLIVAFLTFIHLLILKDIFSQWTLLSSSVFVFFSFLFLSIFFLFFVSPSIFFSAVYSDNL